MKNSHPAKKNRGWRLAAPILAVLLTAAAAQESGDPGDYIVARDTPSWFKASFLDFEEDVAEAADSGKRVMIYFGQDGCPYCKQLHETSFKNSAIVRRLTTHFDSVAVNIFGDVETVWTDGESGSEKELSARLGVQFTPTLLFLGEDGGVVARVYGYRPPEWMDAALAYVAEKKDREGVSFEAYMHDSAKSRAGGAAPAAAFAPPEGDLHAPGRRTMVFVSQNGCELCEEWRQYLQKNAGRWENDFRLVSLNRFGDGPASDAADESEWARGMRISFAPALIFINEKGAEFFRAEAYLRPFHLDTAIEYAKAGAADSHPEFQRFLQERADSMREDGEEVSVW